MTKSSVARCARHAARAISILSVAAVVSPAQSLSYFGGLQYATGDFIFAQRTWSTYFSNGLAWSADRVHVSASIPLVLQPAGWLQYNGSGMMVTTGGIGAGTGRAANAGSAMGHAMNGGTMTPAADVPFSRVGVGDPTGRLELALFRGDANRPLINLVGAVKAPLASVNDGFGTGQWDVGGGLSSALRIDGLSILADAVYWRIGNPAGASLRNAVAYAVSVGRPLPSERWSVLATVSGASSLWSGLEAPAQLGMGLGYQLESQGSVFVTLAAGLTRTAPAVSTGLGWRVPLGTAR